MPFLAFVGVDIVYGWPVAKLNSGGFAFVLGYFVGGLLFATFFPLIIGWVAYRLTHRSQLAGTIGFTLMIVVCGLGVIQENKGPQWGMNTTTRFPAFGVAVDTPAGWTRGQANGATMMTQWISPDSTPNDVRAAIMIEVKNPQSMSLGLLTQRLAMLWKGQVIDEHASLDGEPAMRIAAEAPASGMKPVEGILSMHEGRVYLIMGGVTPGHSCHDQMESIRANWKWIPAGTSTGSN